MKSKFNILVTDSTYKHSLAAIRSLGKKDLKVITCSQGFSPSETSIFSKKSYRYTTKNFISRLIKELKEKDIGVVLPIGYTSNILCSQNKKEISKYSKILIADEKTMSLVSNKESMSKFIKKHHISCPKTYVLSKKQDLKKIKVTSKMVIKSSGELLGKKAEYINTHKELTKKIKERIAYGPQIIQEYISGWGCGFFALCKNGEIKASFQHKRLRQYPASGGVSSLSQSYYNKELEHIGEDILKKLKWTGPAMIEFIFDEQEQKFKFIEFNAKFWGSLDLAIISGVDFPYLYYLTALNKKYKKPSYRKNIKFQWVLPEDTLRLKTTSHKTKEFLLYLKDLFNPKIKKDISYLFIDPFPTIIRIFSTAYKFLIKNET